MSRSGESGERKDRERGQEALPALLSHRRAVRARPLARAWILADTKFPRWKRPNLCHCAQEGPQGAEHVEGQGRRAGVTNCKQEVALDVDSEGLPSFDSLGFQDDASCQQTSRTRSAQVCRRSSARRNTEGEGAAFSTAAGGPKRLRRTVDLWGRAAAWSGSELR